MQVAVLRPAARTSPEQVEATVKLDQGPPLKTNLLTYTPRNSKDYPAVAVMEGQSGRVGFALLIGEDGRVADCTIVATSGVPSLDSQACALLQARAKFEPARDMDGKPAKDSAVGGIVWRIPE